MESEDHHKESSTTCSSSSSSSSSSFYSICSSKMGDNNDEDQPHILAVDDNDVDRKLVERLLKSSSCKVTTAESAMSALEYLGIGEDQQSTSEASKIDLVLTDYCMPGLSGYDLLTKIKESSHAREVPVIIMSSENEPTRIRKCLEDGAKMFIPKPLRLSDAKKIRTQAVKHAHTLD